MKLRLRENSLRFRVNRREADRLASGTALQEQVYFPGETRFSYLVEPSNVRSPEASFSEGMIRISAPTEQFSAWAQSESIGIYFQLPANGGFLNIAIEKDLECLEGPPQERDPDAFPRQKHKNC